jgi:hypothetical protein
VQGWPPPLRHVHGRGVRCVQRSCGARRRDAGTSQDGVATFKGIRYGRAERFGAPKPVIPSSDIVEAVDFGPVCRQQGADQPQSEACLFLNIWISDARAAANKPVLLYIHGSAYSNGNVTDPLNDGRHLAARGDVVVVTLNHRLNALGHPYSRGLIRALPIAAMRANLTSSSRSDGCATTSPRSAATRDVSWPSGNRAAERRSPR